MPSGNSLMEILDGVMLLYHIAAHKQLGKVKYQLHLTTFRLPQTVPRPILLLYDIPSQIITDSTPYWSIPLSWQNLASHPDITKPEPCCQAHRDQVTTCHWTLLCSIAVCPTAVLTCPIYMCCTGFPQPLEIMENLEKSQKSSMHGKIIELGKKLNNHGKIMEFCERF